MLRCLLVLMVGWCCLASHALATPNEGAVACVTASVQGQTDRDEGRLLAARLQLLACANEVCPAVVKKSCNEWLTVLDERIPSVVVRVYEADQGDIIDARVTLDGVGVALDGRPVMLDPGTHHLAVEAPGWLPVSQTFLVAEREQARLLRVRLSRRAPPQDSAGTTNTVPAPVGALAARELPDDAYHLRPFSTPVASWVLGGVGVAGIVGFAVLQSDARRELHRLERSCAPTCTRGQSDSGEHKLVLAHVALGLGIASLVGGGAWALGSWLVDRHRQVPMLSLVPGRRGASAWLSVSY